MAKQPSFFDKTQDDLPLFSGTTPRGKVEPFIPKPKPKQDTIASCLPVWALVISAAKDVGASVKK